MKFYPATFVFYFYSFAVLVVVVAKSDGQTGFDKMRCTLSACTVSFEADEIVFTFVSFVSYV